MALASSDIINWSNPGTKDAMANTYSLVKSTLEKHPLLSAHNIEIFLQGSYANATNIRGDSDVDIVVMLKSSFSPDTSNLSLLEKIIYDNDHSSAVYGAKELRTDVITILNEKFGSARVDPRKKAVRVLKDSNTVDADVVPAIQYRKYLKYTSKLDHLYIEGVKIKPTIGSDIINYPKQHIKNGEQKNSLTNDNFKPAVRQMKQLKRRLVSLNQVDPKRFPGYFVECLTFNVANDAFVGEHHIRLLNVLKDLLGRDLTSFKSVDGIHTLFGTDPGGFQITDAKFLINKMVEEMVG